MGAQLGAPDHSRRGPLAEPLINSHWDRWGYWTSPGPYLVQELRISFLGTPVSSGDPFDYPEFAAIAHFWSLGVATRLPSEKGLPSLNIDWPES